LKDEYITGNLRLVRGMGIAHTSGSFIAETKTTTVFNACNYLFSTGPGYRFIY
jgi:hypothetical protein